MEPLQVDGSQEGVEDPDDHDDEGKGHAEVVQQLVRLVLLGKGPDVEEKSRVSLPRFGG